MRTEAQAHGPNIPPLPAHFTHFRSELGHVLYGDKGYGIPRTDHESHREAELRNFSFFDAPVVAVISMDAALAAVDAMSVGMFVQTFMLALTERGLGSCLLVSVTGYPDVLRKGFGLAEDQMVLCGMAIGRPAEKNQVNGIEVPREEVEKYVTFLDE
nr:nitroreductase nfnb [Quercus suber]